MGLEDWEIRGLGTRELGELRTGVLEEWGIGGL